MRRLAPLLALTIAATCERRAEERMTHSAVREESASSTVAIAVERESSEVRGPVEIVTTTEDFWAPTPCDPLSCPEPGVVAGSATSTRGVMPQGVKRRVVKVERRDPVTRETRQEARAEGQASTEAREAVTSTRAAVVETTRTAGPPPWVWVAVPLGVLVLLALGMWVKRRFGWWG